MNVQSVRRVPTIALFASLLLTFVAGPPEAGASSISLQRIGALANANLDIDGKDDKRVDAGIAIFDTGVDLDNPHINVVEAVDCTGATAENEYACDESPGAGDDEGEDGHWHGTTTARNAAGIDDGSGFVGVAPGARIYGVDEVVNSLDLRLEIAAEYAECLELGGKEVECAEQTVHHWDLGPAIAATKWVTAHADEIDVAVGGPGRVCSIELIPGWYSFCSDEEQVDEYRAAVKEMVDAGVVFVTVSTPAFSDVSLGLGGSSPEDAIVTSVVADGDGLPGGEYKGDPCPEFELKDEDDTLWSISGWGEGVDIAAPSCGFSGAIPQVAGAAALRASADHPETREDVEAIREALIAAGKTGEIAEGGWHDNSGDGFKEPLLDVSDEELFDPVMLPGAYPPPVDSDVDGDGHADLVTLRPNGLVSVFPGSAAGTFGSAVTSFSDGKGAGTLNPATYDGKGNYVIDVADVDADKRADLITLTDDGDVHVYAGEEGATFEEEGATSELEMTPALLGPGGFEPIAVADVSGGGHADLVAYDDQAHDVMIYTGRYDGTFGPGFLARSDLRSALHSGQGHHFLDVADVDGDARADLVTIHNQSLKVFVANNGTTPDGGRQPTFTGPVVSHQGEIDPAMDDGKGYEPVGLGDVSGDGKADLLLLAGAYHAYPGQGNGTFAAPVSSFAGAPTTTFGGKTGSEAAGVIDVTGDGHADLFGAHISGAVNVVEGQEDAKFSLKGLHQSFGTSFHTVQHEQTASANHEIATEQPSWRRRGCAASGCVPGWAIESTTNAGGSTDNRMTDVSCTSGEFCFATANAIYGSTSYSYAETWNGTSWTHRGGIPENIGTQLNGASCAAANNCMAVGSKTAEGKTTTFAVHWNGSKWTSQETFNPEGGENRLTDISCTSPTFCMATGNLLPWWNWSYSYIARWNGEEWAMTPYTPDNTRVHLSGVSCVSAQVCTAVGHYTDEEGSKVTTLAWHWDGESWSTAVTPNGWGVDNNRLTDVSCTSESFCVATGNLLTPGGWSYAYTAHWDGKAWSMGGALQGPGGNLRTELRGVSCLSAQVCTAVGTYADEEGDVFTRVYHWDEDAWIIESSPNVGSDDSRLEGVSCAPSCRAVGSSSDGEGTETLGEHGPQAQP